MPNSAPNSSSRRTSSSASAAEFSRPGASRTHSIRHPPRGPLLDHRLHRPHTVRQCRGPRLQDEGRLDLSHKPITHRWHLVPTRPCGHLARLELLTAPGPENDIGRPPHDLVSVSDDPVLPERLHRQLRETIISTGQLDELRHPTDGRDLRLIPLLEIHLRPPGQHRRTLANLGEAQGELSDEIECLRLAADHPTECSDHPQDVLDTAMSEHE